MTAPELPVPIELERGFLEYAVLTGSVDAGYYHEMTFWADERDKTIDGTYTRPVRAWIHRSILCILLFPAHPPRTQE